MTSTKNSAKKSSYDMLIIGGGMVGASLAVALKPLGYKIGLIDAYSFGETQQPSYDDRSIALSHGSSQIYSGMGIWDSLQSGVTAIKKIHISDKGHFGSTRLSAEQEKIPALGYLVESRVLGNHLYQQLKDSDIEQHTATITQIQTAADALHISLIKQGKNNEGANKQRTNNETTTLTCKLLVAADGAHSKTRQLMGIPVDHEPYQQSGIIANVTPEKPHMNQAFERFTANGPIALLPLTENRCSLIWTQPTSTVEEIMQLNDHDFLYNLQKAFGYRLGSFLKVGKRSAFPLALSKAQHITSTRTVLIGNAAQTLHPVAGQGLNLGLRDIAQLAELLADKTYHTDPGNVKMLEAYASHRQPDRNTVIKYTDSLVKIFSNDSEILGHARAGGLMLIDRIPALRRLLTHQSMGYRHRKTRLARGLPIQ